MTHPRSDGLSARNLFTKKAPPITCASSECNQCRCSKDGLACKDATGKKDIFLRLKCQKRCDMSTCEYVARGNRNRNYGKHGEGAPEGFKLNIGETMQQCTAAHIATPDHPCNE